MELPLRRHLPEMPTIGQKTYYYAYAQNFRGRPYLSNAFKTAKERDDWAFVNFRGVAPPWIPFEAPTKDKYKVVPYMRAAVMGALPKDGSQLDIVTQRVRHQQGV